MRKSHRIEKFYLAHFGQSKATLDAWIKSLHPTKLMDDTRVIEYTIEPKGRVASRELTLIKGSQVYSDSNNEPLIDAETADPIQATLAGITDSSDTSGPSVAVPVEAGGSFVQVGGTGNAGDGLGGSSLVGTVIAAGGFAAELASGFNQKNISPGGPIQPNAVPEPTAVLVLGVGIAGLVRRRKKN